ncbi:hypothetical protein CRYUN_Cryun15aG0100000 [Craigia yunnanensis]
MAIYFPGFPWWFWRGGSKDKQPVSNGSSLNSDWGLGLREPETVKFQTKIAPAKGKGKCQGSEERMKVDKECDVVVVPSDGVHLSGYESDGPEWSIGWEEPHGPGFQGDDEDDGGFAVLVPCYRPGCKELVEGPNNRLLSAIKNLPNGFSSGPSHLHLLTRCFKLGERWRATSSGQGGVEGAYTAKAKASGYYEREATLCSSGFLLFRTSESLEVADRVTVDEISVNISARGTLEEVILL